MDPLTVATAAATIVGTLSKIAEPFIGSVGSGNDNEYEQNVNREIQAEKQLAESALSVMEADAPEREEIISLFQAELSAWGPPGQRNRNVANPENFKKEISRIKSEYLAKQSNLSTSTQTANPQTYGVSTDMPYLFSMGGNVSGNNNVYMYGAAALFVIGLVVYLARGKS